MVMATGAAFSRQDGSRIGVFVEQLKTGMNRLQTEVGDAPI